MIKLLKCTLIILIIIDFILLLVDEIKDYKKLKKKNLKNWILAKKENRSVSNFIEYLIEKLEKGE